VKTPLGDEHVERAVKHRAQRPSTIFVTFLATAQELKK
jgi:hypothetical protein